MYSSVQRIQEVAQGRLHFGFGSLCCFVRCHVERMRARGRVRRRAGKDASCQQWLGRRNAPRMCCRRRRVASRHCVVSRCGHGRGSAKENSRFRAIFRRKRGCRMVYGRGCPFFGSRCHTMGPVSFRRDGEGRENH